MTKLITGIFSVILILGLVGVALHLTGVISSANNDTSDELHTVRFMRGDVLVREKQFGHGTLANICCVHFNETGFMGWAFYGSINTVSQVLILRDMTFRALIVTDEVVFNLTENEQSFVTTRDTVVEFVRNDGIWFQRIVGAGSTIRFEISEASGTMYQFHVFVNNEMAYQVTTSGEISVRGRALV